MLKRIRTSAENLAISIMDRVVVVAAVNTIATIVGATTPPTAKTTEVTRSMARLTTIPTLVYKPS